MKKIKLLTLGENSNKIVLNYQETLKNLLQYPSNPQVGFSIDEIRKSVKIIELLEDEKLLELIVDESDYQFILGRVKDHRFGIAHQYIVQFVTDLENAETIKDEEKKVEVSKDEPKP